MYAPAGEYFATNMSLCAKLVIQPAPRSIEFSNDPVTTTFPLPSHATPLPACVASALPKRRDQRWPPVGESLARKMSTPALVSAPPPKSARPENAPATAMLPLGSTATALPELENESPMPIDHRCKPAGENFATATCRRRWPAPPRPVPPPRSPRRHWDHIAAPVGEYFDTNPAAGGHTPPPPKSTLLSPRPVITALPLASTATP